jgi:hypothetical protein
MVKLVTTERIIDTMNAIAREEREGDVHPNQRNIEMGTTGNASGESESDPVAVQEEIRKENTEGKPGATLEENPEEIQEEVNKEASAETQGEASEEIQPKPRMTNRSGRQVV